MLVFTRLYGVTSQKTATSNLFIVCVINFHLLYIAMYLKACCLTLKCLVTISVPNQVF
jgi:hypothetical protein